MKKATCVYIAVLVLATACTKNITDLNNNPKNPLTAPSTAVFMAAEKNFMDTYTTPAIGTAPFRVLAQSWTECTYTTEARYNLAAYNAPGGWWTALYTMVINNLEQAKQLYGTDIADGGVRRNDLIITDIMEIYAWHLLVTCYGNLPYNQSENRTIPFPKYDDAKTIYADLLSRLDTCIAGLNTGSGSLGAQDQIYNGDIGHWQKFAATLKLKMALLIADNDAATASKKVLEAIATGVFTSNADNATMTYDQSSTNTSNPVWQTLINSGRHDFLPASYMVNTMKSWNDPRIPFFYALNGQPDFVGGTAGAGNSFNSYSTFSGEWSNPSYPGDFLDYAESEFLLAEALERGIPVTGTAELHYNNAITASILFWGGSAADAVAYLAQPAVAYTTAAGSWRQKIGYQKWIAFANRNYDSWLEIRRLGFPNLDVVSPPVGAIGNLPLRFNYPPAEQTNNPANWAAAVKAVTGGGADVVSAKLWFMQ
jgi:SusD/RagB-like outer membrane lipoprotein